MSPVAEQESVGWRWRSLQGFAFLSAVSSVFPIQFGDLPGKHCSFILFVSEIIQGHADILKRL